MQSNLVPPLGIDRITASRMLFGFGCGTAFGILARFMQSTLHPPASMDWRGIVFCAGAGVIVGWLGGLLRRRCCPLCGEAMGPPQTERVGRVPERSRRQDGRIDDSHLIRPSNTGGGNIMMAFYLCKRCDLEFSVDDMIGLQSRMQVDSKRAKHVIAEAPTRSDVEKLLRG